MTLEEFLLVRIAEDEKFAVTDWSAGRAWSGSGLPPDPTRIVAECEAKRQLLDLHKLVTEDYTGEWWTDQRKSYVKTGCDNCRDCGVDGQDYLSNGPCRTLRLLALPYADHSDYRDEWRP